MNTSQLLRANCRDKLPKMHWTSEGWYEIVNDKGITVINFYIHLDFPRQFGHAIAGESTSVEHKLRSLMSQCFAA